MALALALAAGAPAFAAAPPAAPAYVPVPPYYSIQLGSARDRAQALARMKPYANERLIRAELRKSGWQIRVGVYPRRKDAEAALEAFAARGTRDARILAMETAVPWLLPDGKTLALAPPPKPKPAPRPQNPVPSAEAAAAAPVMLPKPLPEVPRATPVTPVTPPDDDFRAAATMLDTEVRRWLRDHGVARRDGSTYTLDLAPLMLYAAQRGDAQLYEQLRPAAQRMILREDEGVFTRGFVVWRRPAAGKPEVSGAREALWLARALSAGAKAFGRDADRVQAREVLDGYARHAFELQGFWLVRKYFSLAEGGGFASLSGPAQYDADFVGAMEAEVPALRGFGERSYATIERLQTPAGLLYPLIQPEVGATYTGMNVDVYGPNALASLDDACLGAEGAARGRPRIARTLLDFVLDGDHRSRSGTLWSYYDARSGDPVGDSLLSPTGYACLVRLAVALDEGGALKRLAPQLRAEMQRLAEAPQVSEAPLYVAGPMLMAAHAAGAFNER